VNEAVIEQLHGAFLGSLENGKVLQRFSLHGLNMEFVCRLDIKLDWCYRQYGEEVFNSHTAITQRISPGYLPDSLPKRLLFVKIWNDLDRVLEALINILLLIDGRCVEK
jgi:hypothetical protein